MFHACDPKETVDYEFNYIYLVSNIANCGAATVGLYIPIFCPSGPYQNERVAPPMRSVGVKVIISALFPTSPNIVRAKIYSGNTFANSFGPYI